MDILEKLLSIESKEKSQKKTFGTLVYQTFIQKTTNCFLKTIKFIG